MTCDTQEVSMVKGLLWRQIPSPYLTHKPFSSLLLIDI